MSNNIIIQENGIDKQIDADKLRLMLMSGNQDYVPGDVVKVGLLNVWRNGTYTPSSFNVDIFDIVVAQIKSGRGKAALNGPPVDLKIVPIAPGIREGGKTVWMGGTKKIKVNVSGGETLMMIPEMHITSLTITEEGLYRAYDHGLTGYDSVTVRIPGGGGGTATPPAYIKITTPPNKTTYEAGEEIDYTGIVVKAYDSTGNLWTGDGEYPGGVIPEWELVMPVDKADFTKGVYVKSDLETGLTEEFPVDGVGNCWGDTNGYENTSHLYMGFGTSVFTMCYINGILYKVVASKEPGDQFAIYYSEDGRTRYYTLNRSFTYNGKTVYYWLDTQGSWSRVTTYYPDATNTGSLNYANIAWTMVYGEVCGALVPIEWNYNESHYSDNFMISET